MVKKGCEEVVKSRDMVTSAGFACSFSASPWPYCRTFRLGGQSRAVQKDEVSQNSLKARIVWAGARERMHKSECCYRKLRRLERE
jgi:hypothetical protein